MSRIIEKEKSFNQPRKGVTLWLNLVRDDAVKKKRKFAA